MSFLNKIKKAMHKEQKEVDAESEKISKIERDLQNEKELLLKEKQKKELEIKNSDFILNKKNKKTEKFEVLKPFYELKNIKLPEIEKTVSVDDSNIKEVIAEKKEKDSEINKILDNLKERDFKKKLDRILTPIDEEKRLLEESKRIEEENNQKQEAKKISLFLDEIADETADKIANCIEEHEREEFYLKELSMKEELEWQKHKRLLKLIEDEEKKQKTNKNSKKEI